MFQKIINSKMLNEKYIECYTNLPIKDLSKDQTKGLRCIIEYESINEWNEQVKSFCVFPPQSLQAPTDQIEFDWMLENRLSDMKLTGYTNINIQCKGSRVWNRYIRSLK